MLFIHWWMDNRGVRDGPTEAPFPMEMEEAEWEEQYLVWGQYILTDELLEAHTKPYEPPKEIET